MKRTITFAVAIVLLTTGLRADERKLSAAFLSGIGLKYTGKILIQNDRKAITAFAADGDIQRALFSLRSTPIASHPVGSVYQSRAAVRGSVPAYLTALFAEAAETAGVDPRLIVAVAGRESAYRSNAMSPVGACGLMQLMPKTARFLGVQNIFDERENIFAGARYLRTLLDTFNGDLDLTLAAYNAGPGAVAKYRGVPPYRETVAYVANVRSRYQRLVAE
jgi:soluble lytic murein transglycosylase-like protein